MVWSCHTIVSIVAATIRVGLIKPRWTLAIIILASCKFLALRTSCEDSFGTTAERRNEQRKLKVHSDIAIDISGLSVGGNDKLVFKNRIAFYVLDTLVCSNISQDQDLAGWRKPEIQSPVLLLIVWIN
ncbi:hypothetical protein J6590_067635 [Homalodisca vitripennis]|nr:hypothetical protein J6590_067635 [Homalodisca vitripennis]